MNGSGSKYTVWHYVGCGCAILLVLGILGVGGCFWMATNWGRQLESEIKDPAARAAKARSLLGYEELPQGYHPGISFSVPYVMEVVILGDKELPAGEGMERMRGDGDLFEERGFIYFKMRAFGQDREDMREDFSGFDFEAEEIVAEGGVEAGGATVRYTAELGETILGTGRIPSVSAELEIDCRDGFFRKAVWFEPIPGASPGQEEIPKESLAGTPADEAALREFLDHFRFCG
ncbi:MAG TPA: hypothetical protein VM599_08005 [Thermoanaerobaculia bacterium]|nr:hypothetical protein [Thermoanaerobaculia bacterium]